MDRKLTTPVSRRARRNLGSQRSEPFTPGFSSYSANYYDYGDVSRADELAPVMPAIDAVKLLEQSSQNKTPETSNDRDASFHQSVIQSTPGSSTQYETCDETIRSNQIEERKDQTTCDETNSSFDEIHTSGRETTNSSNLTHESPSFQTQSDEYEFIPKSYILDVYSNDPEVKRFLKQLNKIANEYGYDEQDYKCYSCRRPIGMVFGQSRLCHFDGHHYCTECHLNEKSILPARILCNWDFNKYPISKRNSHLLSLISNEPMFELKAIAPLLYEMIPELMDMDDLRRQAFFIRSYCFTCAQESVSFELTKQVWPREHLIKQIDLYSIDDLIQLKNGSLRNVLKNAISFGKEHILSCMLCCFKGFFCELCKSSQIIYPFDTETVQRCDQCQSIFHKSCFNQETSAKEDPCPRCRRLKARQHDHESTS